MDNRDEYHEGSSRNERRKRLAIVADPGGHEAVGGFDNPPKRV